jgi:Na+/H+-dicarboxylate symporter
MNNESIKKYQYPILYFTMILLGVLFGLSDNYWINNIGLMVAEMFIRMFKCVSLPIIGLSIIVTISKYQPDGIMKHIWRKTIVYTLSTTYIAGLVSFGLYLLIHPNKISTTSFDKAPSFTNDSYFQVISHIIPENLIAPFFQNQVMSVLLLSIVVGIAIRFIPEDNAKETVTHFFKGIHGLLMVMTTWIIKIIPLGLFGFITTTVIQLKKGMSITGIGEYLLIIVLANLIQAFIVLPIWLKYKGIPPFDAMRKMSRALTVAFFSKSSIGTLPVTMETAEKRLDIRTDISRFVLPLCTSINMNGCAAFIFATVIYLMQNNGVEVSLGSMFLWVNIATIAAIGNAGVPMGCFFLSASLLASMNVSITLMGVILPFYSLIDMLETALNVWSDACVAKVVDHDLKMGESAKMKAVSE